MAKGDDGKGAGCQGDIGATACAWVPSMRRNSWRLEAVVTKIDVLFTNWEASSAGLCLQVCPPLKQKGQCQHKGKAYFSEIECSSHILIID